jgi:hypothetical protein
LTKGKELGQPPFDRAIGQFLYCSRYEGFGGAVPLAALSVDYTPNVVIELVLFFHRRLA